MKQGIFIQGHSSHRKIRKTEDPKSVDYVTDEIFKKGTGILKQAATRKSLKYNKFSSVNIAQYSLLVLFLSIGFH